MPGDQGFTLLEVLVVLVLVSLTMTVLMQGILYTLRLRTQFLVQQQSLQQDFLPEYWFRSSSAALAPAKADSPRVFSGDRDGFSGLSLMSLLGAPGVPIPLEWRLNSRDGRRVLQYRQSGSAQEPVLEIAAWPDTTTAQFDYLDGEGHWGGQWPPPQAAPDVPQLPAALRLRLRDGERPVVWLAPISGRREPPVDPFAELPARP